MMTSGNADAFNLVSTVPQTGYPRYLASLFHLAGLRRSGPLKSDTSEMSMKIYNIRLNTILTSGRASELVRVVVSLDGLPKMACSIWPSVEGLDSSD